MAGFPIAVLISGSGSTLLNLLQRSADGQLRAQVVGVIASRECPGLRYAEKYGVPSEIVSRGKPFNADDFSSRITAVLDRWQPQLVCLGGFLSPYIPPPHLNGRVINIHPGPLPEFGGPGMFGERVHRAVLESALPQTACTVHLVDEQYDHGEILAVRPVPVRAGDTPDTLAERVLAAERELYPDVINRFAAGDLPLSKQP